jgi:hypothetical protein
MKLKASKELEVIHQRALKELSAKELRVFLAWMLDTPDYSAGPKKLCKRLPRMNEREIRRSLKSLVKKDFIVQADKWVETKYRGMQRVAFYNLKTTNARATTPGPNRASIGPANLPNVLSTNLPNLSNLDEYVEMGEEEGCMCVEDEK